ncbi:hypothetical protein [Halorarius litoreus]|uniref:hypothetical protein n=1 Tax=Halorarius litoreus TaxID=2962676 RepID=UPI0020CFE4A8|nr:hypothetical protein [Halorarius litoreus]
MVRNTFSNWNWVEQWGSTLFLLGGLLMAGHATLSGIRAFTDLATPPDVFVATGHFVALVGLLGLFPAIADRTPTTARAAGAALVVASASWFVMSVTQLLAFADVVASLVAVLPASFVVVVLGSTILTYGLFGVAALRVDTWSRRVGVLILAPGGLTVALVVRSITGWTTPVGGVAIGGGLALSMLALGYSLRTMDDRSRLHGTRGGATSG